MSKTLIERARNARTSLGESLHFGLCAELADCVEKLEYENYELRQQLAGKETEVLHIAGKVLLVEQQLALWKEAAAEKNLVIERLKVRADEANDLRQQLASKQAEIDALMLEYCPSEMSQEQLDNWAAHQRPSEWNHDHGYNVELKPYAKGLRLCHVEPVAWLNIAKMAQSGMVYATGFKVSDEQEPLYRAKEQAK